MDSKATCSSLDDTVYDLARQIKEQEDSFFSAALSRYWLWVYQSYPDFIEYLDQCRLAFAQPGGWTILYFQDSPVAKLGPVIITHNGNSAKLYRDQWTIWGPNTEEASSAALAEARPLWQCWKAGVRQA